MRRPLFAMLAILVSATGCQTGQRHVIDATPADEGLAALERAMIGAFSSAAQAARDPENYRDIRLHVARIWANRSDGPWLYVEQAAGTRLEQPYRQRIYHLRPEPAGEFASEIYELPGDPLAFAGAWATPTKFDALTHDDLTARAGCTVFLRRDADGAFRGQTIGTGCESRLADAAYATSEVTITANELRSWDRGFDANHEQVWGATAGPYVFERVRAE